MVSHMMSTCAFVIVIKARDPGKDLPYQLVRHVYVMIGWNVIEGHGTIG
jgi:hypothetical protein